MLDKHPKSVRAAKIGATILAAGAAAPLAASFALGAAGFSAAGVIGGSSLYGHFRTVEHANRLSQVLLLQEPKQLQATLLLAHCSRDVNLSPRSA